MTYYESLEAAAARNPNLNDVRIPAGDDEISLRSKFGLWLNKGSPVIGKPETESNLVYVPGSDKVLDLTRALDGKVHFKQRIITMEFTVLRPKKQWASIRYDLETLLQGQWVRFYFVQGGELWDGLFDVELTPGDFKATVNITVTCDPFRKGMVEASTTAVLGKAVLGKAILGKGTISLQDSMQESAITAQSAEYEKQTFKDGNVLYAEQLNRMEEALSTGSVSSAEKQLLLSLLQKSAYTDTNAETAYNALAQLWESEV